MHIDLLLVLSNGFSFLNIAVVSVIFSSFGNLFCFIHSLMQFASSLQIRLFPSFTVLVGIAPLVFLARSSELMILEMPSLFTKLKSNNCCFNRRFYFRYAWMMFIFSNSTHKLVIRQFIWDAPFFNVYSLSYAVKVIIEVSCYFLIWETSSPFSTSIILSSKFVIIWKERFAKFPKIFRRCTVWHILLEIFCLNFSS